MPTKPDKLADRYSDHCDLNAAFSDEKVPCNCPECREARGEEPAKHKPMTKALQTK